MNQLSFLSLIVGQNLDEHYEPKIFILKIKDIN
jgi:hypothetical protein